MAMRITSLGYDFTIHRDFLNYIVGFTVKPIPSGKSWLARRRNRKPGVKTSFHWNHRGRAGQMLDLHEKYAEVRAYLLKSPWAPDHMVERFSALTRRADLCFEAYSLTGLTETEMATVRQEASDQARKLHSEYSDLLKKLMDEADREQAGDTYAQMQRRFRAVQASTQDEDNAYRTLDSTYQSFMRSSRVEELN